MVSALSVNNLSFLQPSSSAPHSQHAVHQSPNFTLILPTFILPEITTMLTLSTNSLTTIACSFNTDLCTSSSTSLIPRHLTFPTIHHTEGYNSLLCAWAGHINNIQPQVSVPGIPWPYVNLNTHGPLAIHLTVLLLLLHTIHICHYHHHYAMFIVLHQYSHHIYHFFYRHCFDVQYLLQTHSDMIKESGVETQWPSG